MWSGSDVRFGELDWLARLAEHDPRLLADPDGRRILTAADPVLFALLYFRRHLTSPETGGISLSPFHVEMAESALRWTRQDLGPAEIRDAFIAPRGSGKSTWTYLVLPCWALAHGHRRYVAAFADSANQAEQHLATFKRELDTNELLRRDYPTLVAPAVRSTGGAVADNRGMYIAKSGAVFQARGIDSSTLGAKVGSQRPDLQLFDDVEPDASNYSLHQKAKRLDTIVNAVFPMNLNAVVVLAGTVTMHGSVMHDIARQATDPGNAPSWPRDENIRTRYFPAIVAGDDGVERSLWPERWSIEFLQSIRHTRSYALNYDNRPVALDGAYWAPEDIRYGEVEGVTRRVLSIDPAVTSSSRADYTGLSVVGYSPSERACVVEHAEQVRLTPAALRARVLDLLSRFELRHVLLERNQGGDWLAEVLAPLPAKVHTVHQSERKEVRAARVLDHYQSGRVRHARALAQLEEQMLAFPNVANDDLVDSVGSAVLWFLAEAKGASARPRARVLSYA
jgi:phage terminase large subunit-like protein